MRFQDRDEVLAIDASIIAYTRHKPELTAAWRNTEHIDNRAHWVLGALTGPPFMQFRYTILNEAHVLGCNNCVDIGRGVIAVYTSPIPRHGKIVMDPDRPEEGTIILNKTVYDAMKLEPALEQEIAINPYLHKLLQFSEGEKFYVTALHHRPQYECVEQIDKSAEEETLAHMAAMAEELARYDALFMEDLTLVPATRLRTFAKRNISEIVSAVARHSPIARPVARSRTSTLSLV